MKGTVALIARREIVSRLQQRSYRIGLGIALAIIVIACVAPAFFGGKDRPTSYTIGVPTSSAGLGTALHRIGAAEGVHITVHPADPAKARAQVRKGTWNAAVLADGTIVVAHRTDAVVAIVRNGYQLATTVNRLHTAGLSDRQIVTALDVGPQAVQTTASAQSSQRETIAVITVILLFSQLITFCTWVAMGVVEEKASRVVELVLSSVRPVQLLTGKLVGIGVLAAGQVLALGVVALVASTLAGTLTLPASALLTVLVSFIGFVLGYAFFGALSAALGSTVSRQEEVSGILAPVTLTLTVSYGASFATATNPGSGFARALSIIPPFSAIAMPARIAHGGVAMVDVALAVVLLLLAATAVIAVAARVYRASVLHSGTRVSLRRAWRGEAVGDLA